ncbi:MAG: glycine cleavage system protein GcvH [Chloroflexi bacterium]|nr:glycine cleavage system protein GcvH [Chloroflexota bacterium]
MKTPENLKYAKTDEWVKLDGNVATIGISDYAQDQLSDIVFVEYNKDPGDMVKKDDTLATIESVKAAGDVNSPVSGKVIEVNEKLVDNPEFLNDDPYEKAWMLKVEISDMAEVEQLMSSDDYKKYCQERE